MKYILLKGGSSCVAQQVKDLALPQRGAGHSKSAGSVLGLGTSVKRKNNFFLELVVSFGKIQDRLIRIEKIFGRFMEKEH